MIKRVEFTVEATKPNIAAPSSYDPKPELGLSKHNQLEKVLVKPYYQLQIKEGWTFKGESFCEGIGGYGKVEGYADFKDEKCWFRANGDNFLR